MQLGGGTGGGRGGRASSGGGTVATQARRRGRTGGRRRIRGLRGKRGDECPEALSSGRRVDGVVVRRRGPRLSGRSSAGNRRRECPANRGADGRRKAPSLSPQVNGGRRGAPPARGERWKCREERRVLQRDVRTTRRRGHASKRDLRRAECAGDCRELTQSSRGLREAAARTVVGMVNLTPPPLRLFRRHVPASSRCPFPR